MDFFDSKVNKENQTKKDDKLEERKNAMDCKKVEFTYPNFVTRTETSSCVR
jgi:hypothetical protein